MPNLTLQEAAALAAKVNGPFTADAVSDLSFVEASLCGNGIATVGGLGVPIAGLIQVQTQVSITLTSTFRISNQEHTI